MFTGPREHLLGTSVKSAIIHSLTPPQQESHLLYLWNSRHRYLGQEEERNPPTQAISKSPGLGVILCVCLLPSQPLVQSLGSCFLREDKHVFVDESLWLLSCL